MEIFMKHIHADQKLGLDLENKRPDLYLGSRFVEGSKVDIALELTLFSEPEEGLPNRTLPV